MSSNLQYWCTAVHADFVQAGPIVGGVTSKCFGTYIEKTFLHHPRPSSILPFEPAFQQTSPLSCAFPLSAGQLLWPSLPSNIRTKNVQLVRPVRPRSTGSRRQEEASCRNRGEQTASGTKFRVECVCYRYVTAGLPISSERCFLKHKLLLTKHVFP